MKNKRKDNINLKIISRQAKLQKKYKPAIAKSWESQKLKLKRRNPDLLLTNIQKKKGKKLRKQDMAYNQ